MKEQKLATAIKCLLVAGAVHLLTLIYSVYSALKARAEISRLYAQEALSQPPVPGFDVFGTTAIFTVLMVVAIFFVIQDLRKGKGWAWIGALIVLLMSAPSFALPASIFGIICLLDERVRKDFIAQLDIAI